MVFTLGVLSGIQKEYMLAKPARDAAAKAKMETESSLAEEIPLHVDNEWNIRYYFDGIPFKPN